MARTVTMEEVARHSDDGDSWIVIDGVVYDVSKFARLHPGGRVVLREWAGRDATAIFFELHRADVLAKYRRLRVGRVAGAAGVAAVDAQLEPGAVSAVPYTEPSFLHGFHSPYYNDSHRAFLLATRAWIDRELRPVAEQQDRAGTRPSPELLRKVGMAGLFANRIGPGPWMARLREWGIDMPGAPPVFDQFHELIAHAEVARLGYPGFIDGIAAGHQIGLPPILHFGDEAMQRRWAAPCMRGEKMCALAITEPYAGSDVAGLRCTAVKSPCGRFYVVNGVKKWITNGTFADVFVTAVRTGGPGAKGISMLLIERCEGLTTKLIHTQYSTCAGTAYVEYDNVRVPVGNLMGKENDGFRLVMHNFNHERWYIIVNSLGQSRGLIEDCFKWANQRKVFGKRLIEQPVIRAKLGAMVAAQESVWAWLELITHQMQCMTFAERQAKLGGPIALLKYQATRVTHRIADEAAQVFGGRAITRSGMGARVEGFLRFQKYGAIYGGSEEICADLGVRQAVRAIPAAAKL